MYRPKTYLPTLLIGQFASHQGSCSLFSLSLPLFDTSNFQGSKISRVGDFPGGAVVENPPANAGDTGSSPGLGRSQLPRSNKARVPQLLSLLSRACEPQLLSPRATTTDAHPPRARAPQQEKPLQ